MTAGTLGLIRVTMLGLTGLLCLVYAALALWTGQPDPMAWYWPTAMGLASGVVITVSAVAAGRRRARAATDELYHLTNQRALAQAYWLSLGLFAVLALASSRGLVDWRTGFAVLGCLMGAAYLLLFVWHDLRAR